MPPTADANPPAIWASVGRNICPIAMDTPSIADWSWIAPPLALSFIVPAMRAAAPSQFVIESESFAKSSSDALIIASSPDIASCPPSILAFSAFSASDKPSNASRNSSMVCINGFMVPSALTTDIPSWSMAFPDSLVGAANLVIIDRREVPAWSALIPALAIKPVATATSSRSYPKAPATAPAYLNVWPIISTLVLALVEAAAMTSAMCPAWSALIPNAVKSSETISATVARLLPEAAAKSKRPGIPAMICSVFQPAIPR